MQARRLKNGNIEISNRRVISMDRLREMEQSMNPAEQLEAIYIYEALLRNKQRKKRAKEPTNVE